MIDTIKELLHEVVDKRIDELREIMEKIWIKVETINERTKKHTLEISALKKQFKELASVSH